MKSKILLLLGTVCFIAGANAQNSQSKRSILFDDCGQVNYRAISYAQCVNDGFGFIPVVGSVEWCNSGTLVATDAGTVLRTTFSLSGHLEGKNGNLIPFNYNEIFTERNIYRSESYIITFKTGGALGGGLAIEADVSMVVYTDGTLRSEIRNVNVVCN